MADVARRTATRSSCFPRARATRPRRRCCRSRAASFTSRSACPDVEFVPVWIENARRVMPKGKLLPLPLLCTLTVGAPITLAAGEDRDAVRRAARATRCSRCARREASMTPRLQQSPTRCSSASAPCWSWRRSSAGRSSVRWPRASRTPSIDNLNARIKAWWVMVLVIGIAFAVRQARRDPALRLHLVLRAARVHDAHATRGSADYLALAAAFFVVLPVQYVLVYIDWYGLYSIFIPVYVFLLLPIIEVVARRHQALPRAHGEDPVGAHDLRVLHLARAGAAHARHSRLRGAQPAADRLPGDRRAVERRAAVRLGQALRQAQDRAGRLAVEDRGGPRRRRAVARPRSAPRCGGSRRSIPGRPR